MPANLKITATLTGNPGEAFRRRAARLDARRARFVADTTAEVMAQAAQHSPVQTGGLRRGFEQAEQSARFQHSTDHTTATAVNTVRYASFVEYGTRKLAARGMLRRAIDTVRLALPRLWRHADSDS